VFRIALAFALGIALTDALQQSCHTTPATYLITAAGFLSAALLLETPIPRSPRKIPSFPPFRHSVTTRPFLTARLSTLLLLMAVCALGAWRYQTMHDHVVVAWPEGPHDCLAIVRSAPRPRTRSTRYELDIDGHRVYGYAYRRQPAADAAPATFGWGDTLTLRSVVIMPPRPLSDTLTFDYPRYLYTHRISGTVMLPADRIVATSPATAVPLHRWRQTLTARLQTLYAQASLPDDVTAIAAALSLGDRSQLPDTLLDAYADAGASHLLALSGMHVGVLYALLTAALGLVLHGWWGRRLRGLLAAAVLWAFAFLTGLSPSLVRAVTMFTLYAVAGAVSADRSPLNALAVAALLMLGTQPFLLFDVGFQLSFASMLAILLLMPHYRRHYLAHGRPRHPLLYRLGSMVAIAIAAQVGTAPLQLYHFGRFSTWFLVTNLAAVPLMEAAMVLLVTWLLLTLLSTIAMRTAAATTAVAVVATALTTAVAAALTATVRTMNSLLTAIARWPLSSLRVAHFDALDAALMALLYVFLYRYLLKKHTPSALWALGCVVIWLVRRLSDVVFPAVA